METTWSHTLFSFLSFSPGPFWLILFLVPTHKKAMLVFDGYLVLLSFIFTCLALPDVPSLIPIIANPTLETIQTFLASTSGTLGAWNHMILGDLWIGRWIAHDGVRHGVHGLLRAAFILVVLFFGPLGLFMYLLYRFLALKRFALVG